MIRVNVGCGATPTPGWINFDNSLTVRLSGHKWLVQILSAVGILSAGQRAFAQVARAQAIQWADASRRLPLPTSCADVVYSSHMLEHLDKAAARDFMTEIMRVLRPRGVVRIAVPDLMKLAQQYIRESDADAFVAATLLTAPERHGFASSARHWISGKRHHMWMYDGRSLCRLLSDAGFEDATVMPAGQTGISAPGALDLFERASESVYVEALRP